MNFSKDLVLKKSSGVFLNTSAVAASIGTGLTPIYKGIATLLAGPVLDKEDPWFYWYIAFSVIVALAVLLVIILVFWKVSYSYALSILHFKGFLVGLL